MKNIKLVDLILEEIKTSILGIELKQVEALVQLLDKDRRIFCDGAGRSRLQIEGFAMRLTQMGFFSAVVGESTTPAITSGDILLICSGSGETPMLVEHATRAKENGACVCLITATAESSLKDICDGSVIIDASSKARISQFSIQPMGSLFEQSIGILCDIIVLFLMDKYNISNETMYKNHSNLE